MARVYERGIILVNPSLDPFDFDLAETTGKNGIDYSLIEPGRDGVTASKNMVTAPPLTSVFLSFEKGDAG